MHAVRLAQRDLAVGASQVAPFDPTSTAYNFLSPPCSFFRGVAAMPQPAPGTPRPEDRPPTPPTLDEPRPAEQALPATIATGAPVTASPPVRQSAVRSAIPS